MVYYLPNEPSSYVPVRTFRSGLILEPGQHTTEGSFLLNLLNYHTKIPQGAVFKIITRISYGGSDKEFIFPLDIQTSEALRKEQLYFKN